MTDPKPTQDELLAGMCRECAGYGCDECHDTGCCDTYAPVYGDHDEYE